MQHLPGLKGVGSATFLTAVLQFCLSTTAGAATLYVDLNNPDPVPPYTNWVTAATNIQDAVDAAVDGDLVLVTNGVYQAGGRDVYGMSNRVAVTRPVTVRSVNGPAVTCIAGYQVPGTTNGPEAVRCVHLTNGAVLAGFTLTNGATQVSGDTRTNRSGGGVWCESASAVVSNCALVGNSCSWAGGGACQGTLDTCTLASNAATFGGAAYSATLNNCVLSSNWAADSGGGAIQGTLNNCTLANNTAGYGGGARVATLNNCTLTANSASYGGGAYEGTLNNCTLVGNLATLSAAVDRATVNNSIIYYNTAPSGNHSGGTLNYCCTTPLPGGTGNFTGEPQLSSVSHLSADSPCRGAGSATYASGRDIDGEPWADPPSLGCDEFWSGAVTGALTTAIVAAYTNVAVGFSVDFQAMIGGRADASSWDFGSGLVISNRPYASHAWTAPGDFPVVLRAYNESYPAGVAATVAVHVASQPIHYVALESASPEPPYTSWAKAATNIQDAVDASSVPGALVLVSNGVYQTGAREVYGMSNRLAVTKPVTVQSANGPGATIIRGRGPTGTTAVRCVYLTNGALLTGFTLTNGATRNNGNSYRQHCGGGVWCEPVGAGVSNCVLVGNSAYYYGGGACAATLNNCILTNNSAATSAGGAWWSTLNNCTLARNSASEGGGGAMNGTLNNCTLTGNTASGYTRGGGGAWSCSLSNCTLASNVASGSYGAGGGAWWSTLNNCKLSNNSAAYTGGGANGSTLTNCTLVLNVAKGPPGPGQGGGAYGGALYNCTLAFNTADLGGGAMYSTLNNCIVYHNYALSNYLWGTLNYCCTTPLPGSGTGNFTNAPQFVNPSSANVRLQPNSPCINAGNNAYVEGSADLDGNPRIVGGMVDVGAYEFQSPTSALPYYWLQTYGLPTDGSADFADTDNDYHNNWQEWLAGTVPTNAASVLLLAAPATGAGGATLTWLSVTDRIYYVERATDLASAPAFSLLRSNIPGLPGTTSFTDTNPPTAPVFFYRVGIQQ
ncbi:MAG TPA: choice-of-anchor Q domain-containing protein [Candidatus Paceibacterota bacterium]|nr:choice-of-anchor Q domain-containing protein [Verrucomicrobiota bacterium]HSA08759.1 choice-of-anchor Q domain-containing protein [Candidatus Paceibacterota bacterium]